MIGEKVLLRGLEPEDIDTLYSWENNPENWRVSNTTIPFSKHILLQYIQSVQDIYSDKQARFIITSQLNNEVVGCVDLFEFEPQHQRVGIGVLIEQKYRGKGYAKEALKLICHYAFDVLNVHQVYCNILESNAASIKLFEQLGFVLCGTKRDWNLSGVEFEDEWIYQCFKSNLKG